jgi:hypothetical protein
VSLIITEQCMEEVRLWAVKELAEPFVCVSVLVQCCQNNIQQYMIRLKLSERYLNYGFTMYFFSSLTQ